MAVRKEKEKFPQWSIIVPNFIWHCLHSSHIICGDHWPTTWNRNTAFDALVVSLCMKYFWIKNILRISILVLSKHKNRNGDPFLIFHHYLQVKSNTTAGWEKSLPIFETLAQKAFQAMFVSSICKYSSSLARVGECNNNNNI